MKKILLSLITLLCTLSVSAENVVITLQDGGADTDKSTALSTVSTCWSSSLEDVRLTEVSSIYQGKTGYGWKFGTGKKKGYVTFTLPAAMNVKEIVVHAACWKSTSNGNLDNNQLNISYNGGAVETYDWTDADNLADYTLSVDGEVTSVTVGSSALRMYVTSITLVEKVEEANTEPVAINDVSELKEGKLYVLYNLRGTPYIPTATNGAQPVGVASIDDAERFTLIASQRVENSYYLYSTTLGKFLTAGTPIDNNFYVDVPTGCYQFGRHTYNGNEYFRLTSSANDCMLMTGGSSQLLTNDSWSVADDGDSWRIAEVGNLSTPISAEALAAVEACEPTIPIDILSLSEIQTGKAYTIVVADNSRGTWTYNATEPAHLYSTEKAGTSVDRTNVAQQFGFVKTKNGIYAYSLGAKKFLTYDTAESGCVGFTDDPSAFTYDMLTSANADYPFVLAIDGHHVGVSNNYTYGIITFWNHLGDDGNCFKLVEVGNAEMSEAIAAVEAYEATLPTYVYTPDELKPGKAYTMTTSRGAIVNTADDAGYITYATSADKANANHKWAVVSYQSNKYLYNIGTETFALRLENTDTELESSPYLYIGMTDTEAPAVASLGESGNFTYPITIALDGNLINVSTYYANHGVVCNGWNIADEGNSFRIEEVEDFDPTTAQAKLAALLGGATSDYVMFLSKSGDKYYAMSSEKGSTNNSLAAVEVVYDETFNVAKIPAENTNLYWTVEANGEGGYYIKSYDGKYLTATSGKTDLTLKDTPCAWDFDSAKNLYYLGTRNFFYSTSGYFKNFAVSNIGKDGYADVNTFGTAYMIDPEVGVRTVSVATAPAAAYNLAGQRIAAPRVGLYIIGGKKVVVK